VKWGTGQVHVWIWLSGEDSRVILHHQGVGELGSHGGPEGVSLLPQSPKHVKGIAVFQVHVERFWPETEVSVPHQVMKQVLDLTEAQESGVQFEDDVKTQLLHEEEGHGLDLVGGASMEGGEGDAVRDGPG
jgi:hypothetical protein